MAASPEPGKYPDRAILLFLLAVALFASPLTAWWTAPGSRWYLPYVLWGLVIALGSWLQQRRDAA